MAQNEKAVSTTDGVLGLIDNYDREAGASAQSTYAESGAFDTGFSDKPGHQIPKAGVYAGTGVGHVTSRYGVFEADAKGPSASTEAGVTPLGAQAIARAEIASVSASAGPLRVKAGLGVDTGVKVGASGVEVKLLGTGFAIGRETNVSILGNEVSCSVM
uniref:Uncharacterized protein n=1 Tax=Scleropages formosus TaxID=113540 RepID=A0A8C9WGR4_SCLFO